MWELISTQRAAPTSFVAEVTETSIDPTPKERGSGDLARQIPAPTDLAKPRSYRLAEPLGNEWRRLIQMGGA